MKQLRQCLANDDQRWKPTLFPFLSVLLSTMGIMSFFQLMFAFVDGTEISLDAGSGGQGATPYQIFCGQAGALLVPPPPEALPNKVRRGSAPAQQVLARRTERRTLAVRQVSRATPHATPDGTVPSAFDGPATATPGAFKEILEEVAILNRLGRQADFSYEEVLIIGVYPDGSDCYFQLLAALSQLQDEVRIGSIPLKPEWHILIDG